RDVRAPGRATPRPGRRDRARRRLPRLRRRRPLPAAGRPPPRGPALRPARGRRRGPDAAPRPRRGPAAARRPRLPPPRQGGRAVRALRPPLPRLRRRDRRRGADVSRRGQGVPVGGGPVPSPALSGVLTQVSWPALTWSGQGRTLAGGQRGAAP